MPFTMPNYQPLSWEQANPTLTGAEHGAKLANTMSDYITKALEQQKQSQLLPFAVPTAVANNASKEAYARLLGPQYVAKLLSNEGVMANTPDNLRHQAVTGVVNAGLPQGNGNPYQNISQQNYQPLNQNLNPHISNAVSNTQQPNNQNNGRINEPYLNENQSSQQNPYQQKQGTYEENIGNYKGVIAEGKKSGEIRANDIKELNDTYFNAQTKQATLDDISKIISSPEFEQIRQNPLAGHYELSYYSKFGTPEQKNMVGRYYAQTGNIIKDSSRDFAGQFRKGEQQLLSGMKPSPSDTVDVARGKVEALSTMNKMLVERTKVASTLMSDYHMNKLKASEAADKSINGDKIRQQVHEQLYPNVTIRNNKTGEVKTISAEEARKLGVQNV